MLFHDCLKCPLLRYFTKTGSIVTTEVYIDIKGCSLDDMGLWNVCHVNRGRVGRRVGFNSPVVTGEGLQLCFDCKDGTVNGLNIFVRGLNLIFNSFFARISLTLFQSAFPISGAVI